MKQLGVLLLPHGQDAMLIHRRVTPRSMSPVPIYTLEVSCLRKQQSNTEANLS